MKTITENEYRELRQRYNAHTEWVKTLGRNWYKTDEVPAELRISNEETAQIEVYEWIHNPPSKYSLYIHENDKTAVTWMGDKLGRVLGDIRAKKDRIGITVIGNNGVIYHGMYYKSNGDLAHIAAYKDQAKIKRELGIPE